ncbi:MAG: hypothetical protein GY930_08670 [bacterium]|nr:hypothetical protein [bacterium]
MKKSILALAAIAATVTFASAQSHVVGINYRGADTMFTSDTANFLTNWTAGSGTSGSRLFALDFDATATSIYAIDYDTSEYGILDEVTGIFAPMGATTFPITSVNGLTAHPNGTTWYAMSGDALWVGDMTTGNFTMVGVSGPTHLIDIACDSQGNLFAHSLTDDSLHSIDSITGVATLLGPIGVDINYAQGMDFDWSNDTLYATLYTGGGTGQFVSLDTTTGAILSWEVTDTLDAEMEMTVQVGSAAPSGIGTPFCDPNSPNSTGASTQLTGSWLTGGGIAGGLSDLHLECSNGVSGELGYFLVGSSFVEPGLTVSNGQLCIASGPFFRYNVLGTTGNSVGLFNASGVLRNFAGTSSVGPAGAETGFDVPEALVGGAMTIASGSTWNFQVWHRDTPAGTGTSNFSNGLSVTFP